MKPGKDGSNRPPLRVGLLLHSLTIAAWLERTLARIDESAFADIVLVVLRKPPPSRSRRPRGVHGRVLRAIERSGAPDRNSALEPRSVEQRFAQVPMIFMASPTEGAAAELGGADTDAIRSLDLDVLLSLDAREPPGELLPLAKFGAWSLRGNDGIRQIDDRLGLQEVHEGDRTITASLHLQLADPDTRTELARIRTAVHPTSVALTRETLLWGAVGLAPRELDRLHRRGKVHATTRSPTPPPAPPATRPDANDVRKASLPTLARFRVRQVTQRLKRSLLHRWFEERWHLRYALEAAPSTEFRDFEALTPTRDRYWADPMPLFHEDRWHIFFEDFRTDSGQGRISVISFDDAHRPQPPRDALQRPYHLSYPFVFHWDDRLWMIPETASSRAVELYECVGFPDQWELRRRLLEGHYSVDVTLQRHGEAWYLFANEVETPGASSWNELFLYVNEGDLLDGKWTPHPDNPIRSDVTCARPAGPLFRVGDTLYRPAQDCSTRYGGAMAIHEITRLTPGRYAERVAERIQPDWEPGLWGTHTYSHRPGMTVIDAMQVVCRQGLLNRLPDAWLRRLSWFLSARPGGRP